mgnify:CR=1 FL=1
MKQIRLNSLRLKNFKGVRALTLDLQGRDAVVYGDNATGKTTIYDAFLDRKSTRLNSSHYS